MRNERGSEPVSTPTPEIKNVMRKSPSRIAVYHVLIRIVVTLEREEKHTLDRPNHVSARGINSLVLFVTGLQKLFIGQRTTTRTLSQHYFRFRQEQTSSRKRFSRSRINGFFLRLSPLTVSGAFIDNFNNRWTAKKISVLFSYFFKFIFVKRHYRFKLPSPTEMISDAKKMFP